MLTTIVTIAVVPTPNENPRLYWDWKFFIVNGELATFHDCEGDDMEEAFLMGVRAVNPKAVVTKVLIDSFPVEEFLCAGDSETQNTLIKGTLDRLIPLGTLVDE